MGRQAVLIVNTKSRRGQEWFPQAKETLTRLGVELLDTFALRDPARLPQVTRDAIEREAPVVIVGGGDGTLSAVVRHFVGSNSALGVLPFGTGNQFARDLGIAANIEEACRVIAEGREERVDLGIAGNDYFLNVATVGLTTRIADELTVEAKRSMGRFVYVAALVRALRRVQPFRARLITPQGTQTFDSLQVVIGNGRFHAGPFALAPGANITDGKLVVYALTGTSHARLLNFALHLPLGRHVELPHVPTIWTSSGRLETDPSEPVTVDGETVFRTPLEFGVAPAALPVLVPATFTE